MPFIRRKGGQILLVHNRRSIDGRVIQEVVRTFSARAELAEILEDREWERWTRVMTQRYPDIRWGKPPPSPRDVWDVAGGASGPACPVAYATRFCVAPGFQCWGRRSASWDFRVTAMRGRTSVSQPSGSTLCCWQVATKE